MFSFRSALTAALAAAGLLAGSCSALNIIINNDDGWASLHTHELFRVLNEAGHNAWIIAPAYAQSGQSGRIRFTRTANLTIPGVFDSLPVGAPSFGNDPKKPDSRIWYYDGSPAACTLFALDHVVPKHWGDKRPDLILSGPNFGSNEGPAVYDVSGTLAAARTAVSRGVPAIALSASAYGAPRPVSALVPKTASGQPDPATVLATLTKQLLDQLVAQTNGTVGPLFPAGLGLSVNFPHISTLNDTSCVSPPLSHTRISGRAAAYRAVFDETKGVFTPGTVVPDDGEGLNACVAGDCKLEPEADVQDCRTSVSVFTVDPDAPDDDKTRTLIGRVISGAGEPGGPKEQAPPDPARPDGSSHNQPNATLHGGNRQPNVTASVRPPVQTGGAVEGADVRWLSLGMAAVIGVLFSTM